MLSKVRPSLLPVPAAAALLGVVVGSLVVVVGSSFKPPSPALAGILCSPQAIHIHSDEAMFQVLVSPGSVGTDFELQLMSGDGYLLQVREATMVLSLPGREPLERKASLGADGYWHITGVAIPQPGRWHVRIDAVTNFQNIALGDDFELPAP